MTPVTESRLQKEELRAFYQALSALARLYQFRDREDLFREGVTVTECYSLEAVIRTSGISVNGVAAALRLNKSTASRTIEAMEKRGLVERRPDPAEHRAWLVVATAAGRRLHARIAARVMNEYRGVLETVSPSDRKRLTRLLEDIANVTRQRLEPFNAD
jgi:DNA-binding MarR family transcriptional regulator